MTKDGKLNIGPAHNKKFSKLAKLTGTKDTDAIRRIVDNIIFDAEQRGLTTVPIQKIGIKND